MKLKRIHITAVDNIVVPLKTVMELSDDQILASDTDIRHNGIWIEENKKNWGTLINFISGKVKNNEDETEDILAGFNNQDRQYLSQDKQETGAHDICYLDEPCVCLLYGGGM